MTSNTETKSQMGRPREHDRDAIADALIEWAKLPDSLNLNGFCCTREPPIAPSKITIWAKEDENFRKAYEAAKAFIGVRREQMLSLDLLHVKAYDLNAKTYDHFLKEEARQQMEFESSLASKENASYSEKDAQRLDAFTNQVSKLSDALNNSRNNIKSDT